MQVHLLLTSTPKETMNRLTKLVTFTFTFALLTACTATKPLPRCTDDFKPINSGTVVTKP